MLSQNSFIPFVLSVEVNKVVSLHALKPSRLFEINDMTCHMSVSFFPF